MMIESEEEEENNDLELELQTDNANNWKNKFSCEVSNVQSLIMNILPTKRKDAQDSVWQIR